jgi:ATP-binding cassette subfamily B protein
VLHDISFDVPSGTTTALVGATGSGKSTLVSLLMRYYDLPADGSGGTIRLGAHDVRQYRTADLRSTLGLVMQDVFLFSGSIHDNITLQNPAISRARVEECARLVGAHHFIERLPGGYDYPVGERGATLAAGQRQLLNFVRILVYDPQVLLLDEATANIDTETEQLIQRAVRTVLQGRTALVVAHRLSTIQHADQIIVLHKGRLRERGTHAELLSQGGLYHTLYELQHAQPHVA